MSWRETGEIRFSCDIPNPALREFVHNYQSLLTYNPWQHTQRHAYSSSLSNVVCCLTVYSCHNLRECLLGPIALTSRMTSPTLDKSPFQ